MKDVTKMCELLLPHAQAFSFLTQKVATYATLLPLRVLLLATGKHAVVEENGSTVRSLELLVIVLGYQGEHKEGEAKHHHTLKLNETDEQIFLNVPTSKA